MRKYIGWIVLGLLGLVGLYWLITRTGAGQPAPFFGLNGPTSGLGFAGGIIHDLTNAAGSIFGGFGASSQRPGGTSYAGYSGFSVGEQAAAAGSRVVGNQLVNTDGEALTYDVQ